MRVRAVPGLGDRYVGSVEYMGEGRVLVEAHAEPPPSGRATAFPPAPSLVGDARRLAGGRP